MPSPGPKRSVGALHKVGWGNIRPRWGGGVEHEREACEALLEGQGEVSEGVDREVFPPGWGRSLCLQIKGEIDRGEASRKVPE